MGNNFSYEKKCCNNKKLKKQIKKLQKENIKQQKQINELSRNDIRQNKLRDYNQTLVYQQFKYQNLNLRSLTTIASENGDVPPMQTGRTITHVNLTSTPLDLYLTVGGSNPQEITKLTTLTENGGTYTFQILDYDETNNPIGYNAQYNFNVLNAGDPIPQYNAGPTLVEFGTNQIWSDSDPILRDTFDISCVPAGIGNLICNNGQPCRNVAIQLSYQSGYTQQQAYNFNVGVQIIPPTGTAIPSGDLLTVSVTDSTAPYSSQAIGYPLDTAVPKQQTGSAMVGVAGNYFVNWIDPIVSLGNYV